MNLIEKKKKLDEIKLNLLLDEDEIEPYSALSAEDSLRLEIIEKELNLLRPHHGLLNNTYNIDFNDSGSSPRSNFSHRDNNHNIVKNHYSNNKNSINDDNNDIDNNDDSNNNDNNNKNDNNGDDVHDDDNVHDSDDDDTKEDKDEDKNNSYDDNDIDHNFEGKIESKNEKILVKEFIPGTEISKKDDILSQKSISHLLGHNYLAQQVRTYVQYCKS